MQKVREILVGNTVCLTARYAFHIITSRIFEFSIWHLFIFFPSCIAVTGLGSKQIYLKNGDSSKVAELLESFKKDARSVKLRAGKHQLEDVTDVLKSFLSQIDDALLTKELYPFWISALGNVLKNTWYKKGCMYIFSIRFEGIVNCLPDIHLCYLIIGKTIVVRKINMFSLAAIAYVNQRLFYHL